MQTGELIVAGKDKAIIPLSNIPSKIKCHFKHEHEIIPCNPQHRDCLEYEVHVSNHNHHNKFVLLIEWEVSGVREIIWEVYY